MEYVNQAQGRARPIPASLHTIRGRDVPAPVLTPRRCLGTQRCGSFQLGTLLLGVAALLVGGCAHESEIDRREAAMAGIYAARPPAFLTGPMSLILTNAGAFSARATVPAEQFPGGERARSGQLLCREGKLFFAPEPGEAEPKRAPRGGFAFMWNAATASGYVLSDALQGYAPVSFSTRATNIVLSAPQPVPEKVAGHVCQPAVASVQLSDGNAAAFQVYRAMDLKQFPVQITALSNAPAGSVVLSNVRLSAPEGDVFSPPDGFTKYSSPEAMADELAARHLNYTRKPQENYSPYLFEPGKH